MPNQNDDDEDEGNQELDPFVKFILIVLAVAAAGIMIASLFVKL